MLTLISKKTDDEVEKALINHNLEKSLELTLNSLLEKTNKLTEESGSKPEIIEVKDKNTLDFLYKNWAMTWEGLDEKSFDEALKTCGGENAKGYLIKGEEMNRFYGLHGDNAYPNDLNIFAIYPFKGLAINYGARWFTDIVDNNKRRERYARGMRESFYYLVSDKNGWLDKNSNFIIPKSPEDVKNIVRFNSQKEAEDKLKSLSKDIISKYQPSIDVLSEELKENQSPINCIIRRSNTMKDNLKEEVESDYKLKDFPTKEPEDDDSFWTAEYWKTHKERRF